MAKEQWMEELARLLQTDGRFADYASGVVPNEDIDHWEWFFEAGFTPREAVHADANYGG